VYVIWGSTYYFIKVAVRSVPAFHVVGLRYLLAGVLFLLFCILTGRLKKLPPLREVLASVLLGTLLLVCGNGLVTLGEEKVDSYLAALLVASSPLAVAFFDRVIFRKKLSSLGLSGILVGFSGVAFLLYDGRSIGSSLNPHVLFVIGALLSWSLATSIGHRVKTPSDSMVNSAIQMLFTGIVCSVWMIFKGPSLPVLFQAMTPASGLSILYLAVFGSLGFVSYNYLLKHEPAIRVITYAFVNPVIAVLLGVLVGAEKPVTYLALGIPLVIGGLALMLYGDRLYGRIRRRCKM
jgi:drug/metabolite transporter (DMT)-like permease